VVPILHWSSLPAFKRMGVPDTYAEDSVRQAGHEEQEHQEHRRQLVAAELPHPGRPESHRVADLGGGGARGTGVLAATTASFQGVVRLSGVAKVVRRWHGISFSSRSHRNNAFIYTYLRVVLV